MGLEEYNQKRHFNQTPEPQGKEAKGKGALRFVVHRHQASNLHYDFRLELDGVLKSWAVPKGPSLNPADKRLAVAVEDHPFSYRTFEGDIPEGNYGAGHVDIWDEGTFHAVNPTSRAQEEKQLLQELAEGSLHFVLEGKKLKGEFTLVKMKGRQEDAWLLLKKQDEAATQEPYDAEDHVEGASAKSKKKPAAKTAAKASGTSKTASNPKPGGKGTLAEMPHEVVPMTAKLTDGPFDDDAWLFEVKWDGYRAVAEVEEGAVKLYSRNGKSFKAKYAPVVNALEALPHQAVFDGELVVLDKEGKANFQALQNYQNTPSEHLYYYIFDLLYLNGEDLRHLPLIQRKEKLQDVLAQAKDPLRYSEHRVGEGTAFFKEAQENQWEGIMAKAASSTYQVGKRSAEWLKIKTHLRQEAVIAGYTAPQGSRVHLGALVLGVYEGKKLKYVGQSGSGFNKKSLTELIQKLEPLAQEKSPFSEKVPLTRDVTWVKPELVCELSFAEWTSDGQMRQAIFKGLREDKKAKDVVHEQAVTAPPPQQEKSVSKPAKKTKSAPKQKSAEKEAEALVLELDGHQVPISNPEKLYWPEEGITKKDLVLYYQTMAHVLLPYLQDRPESLLRHPNGIAKPGFFQKDAGDHAPEWVQTTSIKAESTGREVEYIVCQNKATLAYLNNLGCIQLNPWNSRLAHLEKPDYLVLDLDPGENTYDQVVETALVAKQVLEELEIQVYAKTSGATGMHLYVPLAAKWPFEQVKELAFALAKRVHEKLPTLTSLERSPKERRHQIYLDFLQNAIAQTIAAPYCVRPRAGATVSTPLRWEEIKPGLHPSQFTIQNVPQRVEKLGDLFLPVLGKGVDVAKLLQKLKK
ncbi:DNA ligase D [Rufibacter glacialis]|uniref:DNA ligase (ATP) n=1 Tax=Rufibacter glacialis TaxID=1259555 RepID=A0A5M8QNK3_9BACT|nr:DNA ligase D [Rufibacter glacialis]KAA6437659.1 DNA ligase D [Rufibacter glacialis]GGK57435.1 ATP-dependent DNA ligase [Rufibacter glacialis]